MKDTYNKIRTFLSMAIGHFKVNWKSFLYSLQVQCKIRISTKVAYYQNVRFSTTKECYECLNMIQRNNLIILSSSQSNEIQIHKSISIFGIVLPILIP